MSDAFSRRGVLATSLTVGARIASPLQFNHAHSADILSDESDAGAFDPHSGQTPEMLPVRS